MKTKKENQPGTWGFFEDTLELLNQITIRPVKGKAPKCNNDKPKGK